VTGFVPTTDADLEDVLGPPPVAERPTRTRPPFELVETPPAWRLLTAVLEDRELMQVPQVVVPRFAWRGRVTLFAAREKAGKSTLLSAGVAALSVCQLFLDGPLTEGSALWCYQEHVGDLAQRLVRQGCRADKITVLDILEAGESALDAIEKTIAQVRPDLVVVDSLTDAALGRVQDAGHATQWKPIMRRFAMMARNYRCAIVLVHHASKSDGSYRDSTEIGAGVDVIIEVEPLPANQEDTGLRKLRPRGRIPNLAPFTVQYNGTGFSITTGAVPLGMRVLGYVREHPGCSQNAATKAVGAREADVKKELESLIKARLVVDQGDVRGRRFVATENAGRHPGGTWEAPPGQVPSASAMPPGGLTPDSRTPYVIGGSREAVREAPTNDDDELELQLTREGLREGL
jgi:hypothetical protein